MRVRACWLVALCLLALPQSAQATFPGANGKIAFESNRDGNYELYTMEPDGSGVTRLTDNPADDVDPAWSPDGTRIAFSSKRTGFAEIYTMNADGTGIQRLTHYNASAFHPHWSPDGTKLAFSSSKDGALNLYTINADGTGERRLTDQPSIAILFADEWSPDGSRIAYSLSFAIRFSFPYVFTIRPDGTEDGTLVYGQSASWSPDGGKVAFARITNLGDPFSFQTDIFSIGSDHTGETRLTNTDAINEALPSWSPDGSLIAFHASSDGRGEVHVMKPDGTDLRNLTNNPGSFDGDPAWQPLVGPQRADYKNASHFCKALREFLGGENFRNRYGGGANAHGKCVKAIRG